MSTFRSFDFDDGGIVLLDDHDYGVRQAVRVSVEDLQAVAVRDRHASDELLLLGVESIGSQPRKATVLAAGDDGWEIVAQTDDEHFAGVAPSGYKSLVSGGDALYSLHFTNDAGVFVPSDRTFGVLDLNEVDRCALGDGTVWTGEPLIGWNGGTAETSPSTSSSLRPIWP